MHLVTQISSTNSTSASLARTLERYNVTVEHQHLDEFIVAPLQDSWERHEMTVGLYESISRCSFHTVIDDQGLVTREMSLQILQAMLHNRPVLLTELPNFADDVDTFTQHLIASRLHNFFVTNLSKLDVEPLKTVLRHIRATTVDYALNSHDRVLISSKIRNYLREILTTPNEMQMSELSA